LLALRTIRYSKFGLLLAIRPLWKEAIAVIGLFFLVFGWTMTIHPSNDGNWQPEVAQTAWAEIAGDKVTRINEKAKAADRDADFSRRSRRSDRVLAFFR
jgi:hypothetical protein